MNMHSLKTKPSHKAEREKEVLFGLIEAYLETGKPTGSNTLKGSGFDHLSSATIRNYFSKLESDGLLEQQHSSGGRIPTEKAFRLYAEEFLDHGVIETEILEKIEKIASIETKEVSLLIRRALEELSSIADVAAFISTPKFDQDFVIDIKVMPIDARRILLALITDFGAVQTELFMTEQKISNFSAKRIEAYLQFRLTGHNKPDEITAEEETLAGRLYNEAIVRFFVGYSNFSNEEIQRTGLSRMLGYPEFREGAKLAEALALFENQISLRHLLRDTVTHEVLKFWIGEDLSPFGAKSKDTAVLAIPYFINSQAVGAFGILGPSRIPYRKLFGIMKAMSQSLSIAITNNLYKFKLTYRQPERFELLLPETNVPRIGQKSIPLIENKKGNYP
jgi:heat-inducible transcriptional repressor